MKEQVLTDFSPFPEAVLLKKGQIIRISMKGNPRFPTLAEKANAVDTAYTAFSEAVSLAAHGGNEAMSRKDACRQALLKALRILGVNINIEADGNHEMLESTGFPFARPRGGGKKKVDVLKLTPGFRSLTVTIPGHDEAMGYMVHYTEAPVTGDSVWTPIISAHLTFTINNLTSERKYAVRVAPMLHLEELQFSEPVVSKFIE